MALVRAKKDVYLGEHGYHAADEQFDYVGPDNHNLEYLDKKRGSSDDSKYADYDREALKAELTERGIDFAPNAGDANLRGKLEADDAK